MLFWKKRVELPDSFYRELGECGLCGLDCATKSQEIAATNMTVANACELLGGVRDGWLKLLQLIVACPIEVDATSEQQSIHDNMKSYDERRIILSELSGIDPNEPLSAYEHDIDGMEIGRFQLSIVNSQILFGINLQKITKLIAKSANIHHSQLLDVAMRAVKATPRAQQIYGAAMRAQSARTP